MVRNGNAVAYKRYSKDYVRDEAYAKENKLGMWAVSYTHLRAHETSRNRV